MVTTAPLGSSGLQISRAGFGAWAAGGADWWYSWGEQDDATSIAAIRAAVEGGVNWIDTAAVYGLGHSEEVVRQAVAVFPEPARPLLFTKCGFVWDPDRRNDTPAQRGARASVRQECDDSLRRLGVDVIDLFQMHAPPEDVPIEDYWATMIDLRSEGKVRLIGLSNHTLDQIRAAETLGHVDVVQPPFSAIKRAAAADIIPWSEANGTGVITYSPMQAGLLTGGFSKQRMATLDPGDWRNRDDAFRGDAFDRNLGLADALRPIAERRGVTPGVIAIAFVTGWPGVSGAIVGARNADQVAAWLPAVDFVLTDDDQEAVRAAIESSGAGEGPVTPPASTS